MLSPLVCACDQCRSMCAHSTCLPTPAEARELIRRGYGPRLATYAFGGVGSGREYVGPAPAGKEGARALLSTRQGACTFYREGLCELHAVSLKPLEGRIAHHSRHWLPVRAEVQATWRGRQFDSVVAALNRLTGD